VIRLASALFAEPLHHRCRLAAATPAPARATQTDQKKIFKIAHDFFTTKSPRHKGKQEWKFPLGALVSWWFKFFIVR